MTATDTTTATFDPFAGPAIALSVPSTEPQREVWTATQIGRDASLAYNEAAVIRLRGPVHVPALRRAISDLFARHEALRATVSPDGLTLLITEPAETDVPLLDLRAFGAAEAPSLRSAALRREVTEPFDLEHGPLARGLVLQVSDADVDVVMSAHHIVCDGWSFGVLASDLAALYNARRSGGAADLPTAARFSDYARESAAAALAPARSEDERYWLSQFAGALPVLDLPSDRARPPRRTCAAGREDRLIPADVARAVRAAGAISGNSMFVTLLGGFATLLHRLSGQDDLVIGVPSAGQSASGEHGLVGHCVNMLPLRITTDAQVPFEALLAQVRTTSLDAFEHQALSFGSLLARLPIPRDPSRSPLVSVVFNVDRPLPPSSMPFDGLAAVMQTVPRAYENFDLFLNAVESDAGVVLECQYNSALYDGATVRRWLESYELLLRAAAEAPATPLGRLAMLTHADRAALAACNDTVQPLPTVRLVHRLVEEQAIRTPGSTAIAHDGTTLTYAELEARANRLARHLRSIGVQRGTLVGLCLDRTPELITSLLAILKAGAGYVPLDPQYPADRLSYMASDAACAVVITDARLDAELHLTARSVVRLDADAAAISAHPDAPLPASDADAQAHDTAYVIYTSGSTGRPKGVLVPHRSVVNLLCSVQREPGLSSRDTVLAITTLSFDIAVSEVLLPLTVGARIVLASRETASDGASLLELIESAGVTFIDATPATYRLLLAAGWTGRASLRLICTGEAMPRDLAQSLTACAHEVWNGYGPTETTVWSTFARVQAPVDRVLIGRPVANTRIAVLDVLGQPVPIGVPGELFIGGEGVSSGYLNRPDLTAERFLADPVAPGRTWYRTGDLVRLLSTGELECLGRTDNQVKVRGFRIEPGEIEVVIGRWPGVMSVVVVAREDRVNDVRLVAYLVTEDAADVDVDALRAFVRASLPDYMVPNTIVHLDALPLTPSGKVDRKALPAPQAAPIAATGTVFVAPRTAAETIVATLWAEALGVARVSVDDDFFALGGHSLLASQVLARLRRDHGVQLSFRTIFEAPTVRALAAVIDAIAAAGAPQPSIEPIRCRTEASVAPLSVLQERLWMLEELEPAQRSAHAHSASWMLRGDLDLARLERSLRALTMRHATLRTSFRVVAGERQQVIAPESAFVLRRLDLSSLEETAQQAALETFFREQQHTPFDIAVAPLFRAIVVRLSDGAHLLYTLQHGMVWDGWSFDLFLRDLSEFYAADAEGRAPALDGLPVAYGDFASWQAGWLASPEAAQQSAWWRTQLSGDVRELTLPTDHVRPEVSTHAGEQVTLAFTPEEAEQLRTFARQHDATLFMVLFAAYNVLLHRYSGQDDLLVGSPVRARTRPELEDLIGPFVNTVLLRTRLRPDQTFAELLRSIRDVTLDAFSHQELPFERVGTRVPPLRVLFSMQDSRERPVALGPLAVEQYHVPQYFVMNDMMLWMMESRRQLIAVMNYSTELFARASAELFLAQLRALLLAVVAAPERAIAAYDLTTPADHAADAAQSTPAVVPQGVPECVFDWAEREPSRVAVRYGRDALTYGALTARAHAVAGLLGTYGAAPGRAVAVALPPGIDRVVAALAALQRGCPLLLLDPADPEPYVAQVLRAAGIAVYVGDDAAPVFEGVGLLSQSDLRGASELTLTDIAPVSEIAAVITAVPGAGGAISILRTSSLQLAAQARDLGLQLGVQRDSVVLAAQPAGAPTAALELLLPLAHGAMVVLASDDAREDAQDLADALAECDASLLLAPGEIWRALLATPWVPAQGFSGVVTCGALPTPVLRCAMASRVPRAFTLFGQLTDGGASALHRLAASDAANVAGEPIAGARFTVVDAAGRTQATGVPGVLQATSGDVGTPAVVLARRTASGQVQLLQDDPSWIWIDSGVFIGAAVESVLRTHPAIVDAAVVAHRDAAGAPRLVAYVVVQPGAHHTDSELRHLVRACLPRHCVPQRFVQMAEIPRRDDGAIAYAALISPFASVQGGGDVVEARTPAEALLVAAWREVLGVDRVSVTDNFFRLGGTSVLCFRVVEQVRRSTGQLLNPRALLVGTLEQAAAEFTAAPLATAPDSTAADATGVMSRLKGLISGRTG